MDSSASLRDKLHHYIDVADEQKLQEIYVLLENEINWSRRQQHLQGLSKSFTIEESLEAIRPITD